MSSPQVRFGSKRALLVLLLVLLIPLLRQHRRNQALTPRQPLPTTTAIRGPFTVREGLPAAEEVAKRWAADPFLELVRHTTRGGDESPPLGSDGKAVPPDGWSYRFLAPGRPGTLRVDVYADGSCRTEVDQRQVRPGERPLPPDILDSPAALRIAESQFSRWNEARKGEVQNLWAQVTTTPTRWAGVPNGPDPRRPTWQFSYLVYFRKAGQTRPDRSDLYLNLDAVTGEVLTVVEASDGNTSVLENHYPSIQR